MDGAPACPFVAFGDDRDGRSTSPDHRHRCFAESPPAPRALAHQEAYCLSSAFPVCPVFQEWARREAAHARGGGERPETAPTAVPMAAAAAEGASTTGDLEHDAPRTSEPASTTEGPGEPIRRNPPRDWAAPPPWATGAAAASRAGTGAPSPDVASEFLAARAVEGQGLAGSPADRLAGGPAPSSSGSQGAGPGAAALAAGAGAIVGAGAASGAGAGGTGSAASGGWSASAAGSSATAPHDDLAGLVQPRGSSAGAAEAQADQSAPPSRSAADGYPPSTLTGGRPSVSSTRPRGDAIPGPSWERMRRYEAYPEIKTRSGVPGLPRFAVLVGALAVAALALFMLPALLGFGGGGTASPSPSASAARPSASVGPTVRPEPTPLVYVIKQGDNLLKVAKKFNVTLEDLLAANKDTITNPDKIAIGDTIIIPTPPPGSGASKAPAASASASP
jgi:LysM repeat protein